MIVLQHTDKHMQFSLAADTSPEALVKLDEPQAVALVRGLQEVQNALTQIQLGERGRIEREAVKAGTCPRCGGSGLCNHCSGLGQPQVEDQPA